MARPPVFERATHTRLVALSLVDGLAQALRVSGDFPPPMGDVSCRVVARTAPTPSPFDPPLLLGTKRAPSGFVLTEGTYRRESPASMDLPLPGGTYTVRVESAYYRCDPFDLVWPPPGGAPRIPLDANGDPRNVLLLPSAAYPMPDLTVYRSQLGPTILRGSLFTSSGKPVRGVVLEVVGLVTPANAPFTAADWPYLKTESDERGDWAVVLPGRRRIDPRPEAIPPPPQNAPLPILTKAITIRASYPGGPVEEWTRVVELGTESSLRNTALRGQVVGPGGRPIEGARIETSVGPATSATRRDGVWFLYFGLDQPQVPNVTVTATVPDGAQAVASNVTVLARATVVVPTFRFS